MGGWSGCRVNNIQCRMAENRWFWSKNVGEGRKEGKFGQVSVYDREGVAKRE